MITKRSLTMLAAAAASCLMLGSTAIAQTQFRVSTAAAEGDWLNKALQKFKEGIEKDLPGQFAVSVHPNASLFRQGTEVPALAARKSRDEHHDHLRGGAAAPGIRGVVRGLCFRDYDHMRKVFDGPIGKDYADAVAKAMGIQIIETIYLGTRQTNLAKARDVKSPADLAGLKLRMPPGPGWVALGKGLGVTPTPMGIPEVYLALKNGAIDGQENLLTITKVNNFHEVTQQIVMTAHLIQPVFFAIAKPVWDKMTPEQQAVFRKQAKEAAAFNDTSRLAEEKDMVAFFEKAGLKVTIARL